MMAIIDDRRRAGASSRTAATTSGMTGSTPITAGWFDDPEALHRMRYFDGDGWTTHVTHFGPTPCSGCG